MSTVLAAVLVGVIVGIVVGALGAGGGILSVPILVFVLGQTPHSATASSLVIVGSTAVAGLVHHLRRRTVDWANGAAFGLLGVLGSVVGSRISVQLDDRVLLGLFAVLLGLVSVAMFRNALSDRRAERRLTSGRVATAAPRTSTNGQKWLRIIALATLTGLLTGLFGVGGGFIVVPVLVLLLGVPIRTAAGTSLVVMVIASISGLLSRVGTDVVIDWPLTAAFTVGSMAGGLLGGPATARLPGWVLSMTFAGLLAAVALGVGVAVGLGIT